MMPSHQKRGISMLGVTIVGLLLYIPIALLCELVEKYK